MPDGSLDLFLSAVRARAGPPLRRLRAHFADGTVLTYDQPVLVPAAAGESAPRPAVVAGEDCRSVRWGDRVFSFGPVQARAVRLLVDAWDAGTFDVPDEALLRAAGSDQGRLARLFEDRDAWGVMVVPGASRGTHRIADPAHAPPGQF